MGMRGLLLVHGQATCYQHRGRALAVMLVVLACILTRAHAEQKVDEEFVAATAWARASATTGRDCADGGDCQDRMHTSSSYRGSSSGVDSGLGNAPVEEQGAMLFDSNSASADDSAWCAEQRRECNVGCSVFGDMLGSVMFRCDEDEKGGTEAALCVCRDENGAALRSSSRAGAVQSMGAARSSASSMAGVGLG